MQTADHASRWKVCQALAKSSLVPPALQGSPQNVLAVTMLGAEYGLPMMKSIRNIHVIKDSPSMSADLIMGLCLQAPVCEFFYCEKSDEKSATYTTKRTNNPKPTTLTFTIEQAAGYMKGKHGVKDNWRDSAPDMLRHRCTSKLARMVYPDLTTGLYTPGEIAEGVTLEVDAEVVETTPEDQPTVKQEGETKADKLIRDKKREAAEAEAQETVDAELVEDREPGEDPETEEDFDAEPAREEHSEPPEHITLDQADEISEILKGAYKGLKMENQTPKRLQMLEAVDDYLEPLGLRRMELLPTEMFERTKAWAANLAPMIREGA